MIDFRLVLRIAEGLAADLEVQARQDLELPDQRGELPRRQPTPMFAVDGTTLLNENRTVC